MNIVYVLDKKYLPLYELSVRSLLKHNPDASITVVSPEPLGVENNIVLTPPNLKHVENDRITPATYLKLLLPKLPFDKIILIDADTVVQGSLKPIWDMNVYIGATQSHNAGKRQAEEHGHDKYFLAGMMVMNLKKMREDNFTEKSLQPFDFNGQWQHEETIINHYFYDKITEIDKSYNYCHNRKYDNPIPECSAKVLHFCGADKSDMFRYKNLEPIKEFLKGKSVALVGNAKSLFNELYGEEIDHHDVVIRFTHGYITKPESQGTKTDILICAENLDPERIKEYNPKFIINRRKLIDNGTPYYFTNRDKDYCRLGLGRPASSGYLAIDLCDYCDCKIDLYGFDWERTPTFYNPEGYITDHNYPSEELKIRIEYNVNIHGNFKLKKINKRDKLLLKEAKERDEINMPKAKIIEIRGKKFKICPKCGWKHEIQQTECRFCGSQL